MQCDYCGMPITGPAICADGSVFCSEACLDDSSIWTDEELDRDECDLCGAYARRCYCDDDNGVTRCGITGKVIAAS